jgi:hypothetical protein
MLEKQLRTTLPAQWGDVQMRNALRARFPSVQAFNSPSIAFNSIGCITALMFGGVIGAIG